MGSIDHVQSVQHEDSSIVRPMTLPAGLMPAALAGDRMCGVQRDELDVESIRCFVVRPAH